MTPRYTVHPENGGFVVTAHYPHPERTDVTFFVFLDAALEYIRGELWQFS